MEEFIKLFLNHTLYESYKNSAGYVTPNVSYCELQDEVHYNPWVETRVVTTFNVTSTSSATNIMGSSASSLFSEIEIDGIVQPSVVSSYIFDTTGEHTIKYALVDPTSIGSNAFYSCSGLTSVTIPSGVTSIGPSAFTYCASLTSVAIPSGVTRIGSNAFNSCSGLTSITIPSSVTSIGSRAFKNCSKLTNIISLATTAPTIQNNTFQDVKFNGTLTVPNGSSGYDVWMGADNYYLGSYNWTKVEQ